MFKSKWIFFLVFFPQLLFCNNMEKAYKALSVFDYFKSKQLFYNTYNSNKVNASFGLATIFYRTDNPFSNIDSAAKYISISKSYFKDTISFDKYHINRNTINKFASEIAQNGYAKYCSDLSANNLNHYLRLFFFAEENLIESCLLKRDQIVLGNLSAFQRSDSVNVFLMNYPESKLYNKAQKIFYDFEYLENINVTEINSYKRFLKKYQKNYNKLRAEVNLFELTKLLADEDSLYEFINTYSTIQTRDDAWRLLYSNTVKVYSKQNLQNFINKYPQYPYREIINKELNLVEQILIPLKDRSNKFGYIDTLGTWIILPQYDDAMDFSEGFASVCKNDSCFYISKDGKSISASYFEETESYKNGVAIVKKGNVSFLINRSGQIISSPYQEISNLSDDLFVCKKGSLFGAINAAAEIVIPFEYNKLGDFKNGYAYYLTTTFGLVNKKNITIKAEWDWISDCDENEIVIVAREKKYGMLKTNGQIILPSEYDYIKPCSKGIYLIVKNNLYGFYNCIEKCFVTDIEFDYYNTYEPDYYSNGKYFKLLKKDDVALIDANGRYSIPFGLYSNLFFAKCDIVRIQKNNKYGFVDRKLKQVSSIDFNQATDFDDNIAIVEKSENSLLINTFGKIIYSIKDGKILKVNGKYFKVWIEGLELFGLLNSKGENLLPNCYTTIEPLNEFLFRCEKKDDNSIYIFNSKNKIMKKVN